MITIIFNKILCKKNFSIHLETMNFDEIKYFESVGIAIIKQIGFGGYGVVFYVYSNQYQSYFALKKIPEKYYKEAEVECLKVIDDPRKVSLYKVYKFNMCVYLLMEYCPTDLTRVLKVKGKISNDVITKYIKEMILSVKACHDRNIAHSDIKPSNFLIDQYGRIKITDFGLSTIHIDAPKSSLFLGTKLFMAPEIFTQAEYNPIIADVWAIGVSIFYIVTKKYPFFNENDVLLEYQIIHGNYSYEQIHDHDLRDVIQRCLTVNPYKRATIDELLLMPYFMEPQQVSELKPIPTSKSTLNAGKIFKPFSKLPKAIFSVKGGLYPNNAPSSRSIRLNSSMQRLPLGLITPEGDDE